VATSVSAAASHSPACCGVRLGHLGHFKGHFPILFYSDARKEKIGGKAFHLPQVPQIDYAAALYDTMTAPRPETPAASQPRSDTPPQ
jgi:hypothetical protein